jgi:hypothetical protein
MTSIYNYLKQPPQVYMSSIKETNFLERDWESDLSEKKAKILTFEAYGDLFKDVTDEIAIGEASPNYLFHYKTSTPRIKQCVVYSALVLMTSAIFLPILTIS